jgi:hypothetical protein
MTTLNRDEAASVIEDFLIDNPTPQTGDWKRLIDAHPQYAGAIANAALVCGSADADPGDDVERLSDDALFNATISRVLNLVHQTRSPVLAAAQQKVIAIQGPTARKVAVEIGIGPYPSLLSGILVGRTLVPSGVLAALGNRLAVPVAVLAELFARSFRQSEVPAFKAPDGQPQLLMEPLSWDCAVRALKLPPEETERLLRLSDPT